MMPLIASHIPHFAAGMAVGAALIYGAKYLMAGLYVLALALS